MKATKLKKSPILCGLILIILNLANAYTSDPIQIEVIKSLNELKIDDIQDPKSDFSLPSSFLAKFDTPVEHELIKSLSLKKTSFNDQLLTAATETSDNIHKLSSIALQASKKFSSFLSDNDDARIKIISQMKIPEDFCPNAEMITCDPYYPYRGFDGSCNNLANPWWGKTEVPFKRLLQPEYDDKFTSPRTKSHVKNRSLPSARSVANIIHAPIQTRSDESSFFLFFGQSIARDIAAVSQILLADGSVKTCTCNSADSDCFNIPIPNDEKVFRTATCLPFTRSSVSISSFDCYLGAREQLNLASSFLDLEQIYGNNQVVAQALRGIDGLLRFSVSNTYATFPLFNEITGCPTTSTTGCYFSGDRRTEESATLTSVHTLWLREHNYLAANLRQINPDWNEEKVFEEARKINIAQYQHIIYREWLRVLLGESIWEKYELRPLQSKYSYRYDQGLYPNIANEFATAAFRLHQLVNLFISKADTNLNIYEVADISTDFFNISAYTRDADGILRGTLVNGAYYATSQINPTLNNRLYEVLGLTTSLGAINNQRGRDHGIPSYIKFRELCGLGRVNSFNDLTNIPKFLIKELRQLYPSVNDIDLYAGGVSELPVHGGVIGPTFACIIAKQFYDLKFGDRFFYENGQSRYTRLNVHQLDSIRKTSMARILCTNVAIARVARNPFLRPSKHNPYVDCSLFKRLDLRPWYVNTTQLTELENLISNLVY